MLFKKLFARFVITCIGRYRTTKKQQSCRYSEPNPLHAFYHCPGNGAPPVALNTSDPQKQVSIENNTIFDFGHSKGSKGAPAAVLIIALCRNAGSSSALGRAGNEGEAALGNHV